MKIRDGLQKIHDGWRPNSLYKPKFSLKIRDGLQKICDGQIRFINLSFTWKCMTAYRKSVTDEGQIRFINLSFTWKCMTAYRKSVTDEGQIRFINLSFHWKSVTAYRNPWRPNSLYKLKFYLKMHDGLQKIRDGWRPNLACFRLSVSGDDRKAARDERRSGSGRERGCFSPFLSRIPLARIPLAADPACRPSPASSLTESLEQASQIRFINLSFYWKSVTAYRKSVTATWQIRDASVTVIRGFTKAIFGIYGNHFW